MELDMILLIVRTVKRSAFKSLIFSRLALVLLMCLQASAVSLVLVPSIRALELAHLLDTTLHCSAA